MSLISSVICLIACHGASADHFAIFAENLNKEGYEVHIYASKPIQKKFQDRKLRNVTSFNKENLTEDESKDLAVKIAKECSHASAVLTDVGHSFDITLQKALALESPEVLRLAYYDNPESYVPGGYSKVAGEVMLAAKRVLFANANLADTPLYQEQDKELNLPFKDRVGLGYYPLAQAEKIAGRRNENHDSMRRQVFQKYAVEDKDQKILVYFGGNNEEYFGEAFPAFLSFLSEGIEYSDLSNLVFVLQQHPGAKSKNIDRQQLESWIKQYGDKTNSPKIIISDETTDDMQVIAEGALYYQTSMGPQLALAGIPCLQVGHKTYFDVLVRGGLCSSITNSKDFVDVIAQIKPIVVTEEKRKAIYRSLGIREDWFKMLKEALNP